MIWYPILGLIAAAMAGIGLALTQYKRKDAGYSLLITAAVLGIIAGAGWALS
jgi:hypothetical protein